MSIHTFAFTPELFTIDAAAHYLGVSKSSVEKYITKQMLHTYRLPALNGGREYMERILIRRAELDKFIESGVAI